MYDNANLSRAQFDAINRLFSSLDKRDSISGVKLGSTGASAVPHGALTWYLSVEFLSGHGNRAFHVDREGNSAPIEADGLSELMRP